MQATDDPDISRFSSINNIIRRKDAKKSANKNNYTTLRSLRLCGEMVTLRMKITY